MRNFYLLEINNTFALTAIQIVLIATIPLVAYLLTRKNRISKLKEKIASLENEILKYDEEMLNMHKNIAQLKAEKEHLQDELKRVEIARKSKQSAA